MRITVLGGTGRIGRLVVEQALGTGLDVTALVRDPAKLGGLRDMVRVVVGHVSDHAAVSSAVAGADAVISTLGPDRNRVDQVVALRSGMQVVIAAMRQTGVRTIVNLSGAAVDAPDDHKAKIDRIASRIVRLVSGHVVAAKQAEFDELRDSGTPLGRRSPATRHRWTPHGPLSGGESVLRPGARISRADVAAFMLAQAERPTFVHRAPFICY